jgi:hypothetical protein
MEATTIHFDPAVTARSLSKLPSYSLPKVAKIALIGSFAPRRCGIATFTTDVHHALQSRYPSTRIGVWAMNDGMSDYAYPPTVTGQIDQDDLMSYRLAASQISASGAERLWIQHEFGIFGGVAGAHILTLINRLAIPVAVTLHTVLATPYLPNGRS